jgi:hypothetical protein
MLLLRVEILLQDDTELVAKGLELIEVLLVLALVLDLGLDTCWNVSLCCAWCCVEFPTLENADGSGEVVDPSCGLEGSDENRRGGYQVIGEGVVQVSLDCAGGQFIDFVVDISKTMWVVLPGAQKRPGHCRTPSRTCTNVLPVRIR